MIHFALLKVDGGPPFLGHASSPWCSTLSSLTRKLHALAGDGAGILVAIPHDFFARAAGVQLPPPEQYAIGQVNAASHQLRLNTLLQRIPCTCVSCLAEHDDTEVALAAQPFPVASTAGPSRYAALGH